MYITTQSTLFFFLIFKNQSLLKIEQCSYSCFVLTHLSKRARLAQWVGYLDYLTTYTSLSPIRCGFAPGFVNYKKGCIWLAATIDKVYQLLVHGQGFSPGTPASSITKTGRHDIAEILLIVVLNTINQSINHLPKAWRK
jgi:hypothetical protein